MSEDFKALEGKGLEEEEIREWVMVRVAWIVKRV